MLLKKGAWMTGVKRWPWVSAKPVHSHFSLFFCKSQPSFIITGLGWVYTQVHRIIVQVIHQRERMVNNGKLLKMFHNSTICGVNFFHIFFCVCDLCEQQLLGLQWIGLYVFWCLLYITFMQSVCTCVLTFRHSAISWVLYLSSLWEFKIVDKHLWIHC